jgi:hypothetical protein
MRANEQLEGSESTEALARHKADLFFNWARQNGLYYGEMLTPENISKVDDWCASPLSSHPPRCWIEGADASDVCFASELCGGGLRRDARFPGSAMRRRRSARR